MSMHPHKCQYRGPSGNNCEDRVEEGSQWCFWHDPTINKTDMVLKDRLEDRARTRLPMEGFLLNGANLENINLVNSEGDPYRLVYADLSRTNLHRAHLYRVNLSHSNLLKANLSAANLHFTNLSSCNLLGTNLKAAKLDEVIWGEQLLQEQLGFIEKANGRRDESVILFQEAEEVARNLRRNCERQGLFDIAGDFFYREMVIRHNRFKRFSRDHLLSKLVGEISGYGEKPRRVVFFSMCLIAMFSLIFFGLGIEDGGRAIAFDARASLSANVSAWLESLYFSTVTFTTLGYGDITPVGIARFFAALEAFTGSFTMALFVVLFVKKMTR